MVLRDTFQPRQIVLIHLRTGGRGRRDKTASEPATSLFLTTRYLIFTSVPIFPVAYQGFKAHHGFSHGEFCHWRALV